MFLGPSLSLSNSVDFILNIKEFSYNTFYSSRHLNC